MQVILTEAEYLKLKNQHEDDKRMFVKKSDVYLSLEELVKELKSNMNITYSSYNGKEIENIIKRFLERIEL
jgi:hypothetical protein